MEPEEEREVTPERGCWLEFSPEDGEILHEFCGRNEVHGAMCPRCERPLLRLLSVDTRDPLLEIDPERVPFIHLLFCWTCSIPYGPFSYALQRDGSIRLLEVPERMSGEFGLAGPYEGYTGKFPLARVSLRPQTPEVQDALKRRWSGLEYDAWETVFDSRHQVGGYPAISNPTWRDCPVCARRMKIFATICDKAHGELAWKDDKLRSFAGSGGEAQMFFLICRECMVVAGTHGCD